MALAVGLNQAGRVDWSKFREESDVGDSYLLDAEDLALANFLVDLKKDRAVALLAGQHFGTKARYNHESYEAAWSPNSRFLVEVQSWKWHTASATLYALDGEGAVTGSIDLIPVATEQLRIVAGLDHKLSRQMFEERDYRVSLRQSAVDSTGRVTLHATAEVPISLEQPSVSLLIQFTAKAHGKGNLSVENLVVRDAEE